MDVIVAQFDQVLVEWIARFNLFVLPLIVAGALFRLLRAPGITDRLRDRERTVRWAGLVSYALAVYSVLQALPDLTNFRRFGGFASFPVTNFFWPLLAAVLRVPIGFGLRRLRAWARWAEVILNVFVVLFISIAAWFWSFGASFDLAHWPDLAFTYVLPFFLVAVMLSPRTAQVCSAAYRAAIAERPVQPAVRWSITSALIAAFFLLVVVEIVAAGSTLGQLEILGEPQI